MTEWDCLGMSECHLGIMRKVILAMPLLLTFPAVAQLEPSPLLPPTGRIVAPRRFDQSLEELIRQGVIGPDAPVRWGRRGTITPDSTNKPALSPREQALLETIRAQKQSSKSQWRSYGQCSYDWSSWHLHPNGARTTTADCGGTAMRWTIAVSCDRLLVATHTTASGWSDWEQPSGPESKFRQGEDEMVAALCANTK